MLLASALFGAAVAILMVIARLRNPPRALGWAFCLLLFLALASCLAGCAGGSFVDAPPTQFRGPGFYAVRTVPTAQIATACAGVSTAGERRGVVVGCAKGSVVILPNPCEWSDPYAQLACHEQAHAARGWANDHPR